MLRLLIETKGKRKTRLKFGLIIIKPKADEKKKVAKKITKSFGDRWGG